MRYCRPACVRPPQQQQADVAGVALARQCGDSVEQLRGGEVGLARITLQHQVGHHLDPPVDCPRDRHPVGRQDREAGGDRGDQEQGQDSDGQPAQRQTTDRALDHGFSE